MTGQVYKYKDSITLSANAQSVETTSFYTTNTEFVNVMLNRSNADKLLVEGTDYTIEKVSNDIQSLVRVTAIGDPFLAGDTLTFILNKDAKTTLSFTSESVRGITPSTVQDNNEGTLETMAAVLGEAEENTANADAETLKAAETYADGQDAIQSTLDRGYFNDVLNMQLGAIREKDREQDDKINEPGTLLIPGKVDTTQKTFFHDPNRILKQRGVPLHRVISILNGDEGEAAKAIYTERQTGTFVSAANFRPLTTETLTVDGESHEALVITVPGDFNEQTFLAVEFNDTDTELAKTIYIPVQTISNGFDWVISDARPQEDAHKRELRVRLAYDSDTDLTQIKFHQEAVPGSSDTSTEIYLYIGFFLRLISKALLAEPNHFVRTVRKEGVSISDKDYYVENVAEIVQTDEFYIVNPTASELGDIDAANAGRFAIKDEDGYIDYKPPVNGDTAMVYADRQVDITDGDGNVSRENENRLVAILIYEGQWIITNSYFKNGNNNSETGAFANAEGSGNTASGNSSHAEGGNNVVSGIASHAEGAGNTVSGWNAHAEGRGNTVGGLYGHAEGQFNDVNGESAHAEGNNNSADGRNSHAEGSGNTVKIKDAHIQGRNAAIAEANTLFGIGNGSRLPTDDELNGSVDVNLVYKVDGDGNSTQTGKVVAADFEKADGTNIGDLSAYSTTAEVDAKDDEHLTEANTYTNAEINKVKNLIDNIQTGLTGHSIDANGNLILNFADGTSETINLSTLLSDEIAAIELRLDAIEAKNRAQDTKFSEYYTKTESDANDVATLSSAADAVRLFTFDKGTISDKDAETLTAANTATDTKLGDYSLTTAVDSKDATTLQAAKDYTDNNAVGKFVDSVAVNNGKIKLGYSDDSTAIESTQFLPSPANQPHARVMVTAARNASSEINLTGATSTDVTGTINSLSDSAPNNERIDGQHIQTHSIPTDRIVGGINHAVKVTRKEGTEVGDKDYYVENTAEIVQQNEYYIVNPVVADLGTIADAEAGKYAIKNGSTITYTAPENGDMAFIYADRQVDIPDGDGNVVNAQENRIVAILIYEGGKWIITSSYFKVGNNITESGIWANAEGTGTKATALAAHAEGQNTTASGNAAHSEGTGTVAKAEFSHAEGYFTQANAFAAHAEGQDTTTNISSTTISGKNAVLGNSTTAAAVGWGDDTPTDNEKAGNVDINVIWKVVKNGDTRQTGKVVASGFELTDGTVITGGDSNAARKAIEGLTSDMEWKAEVQNYNSLSVPTSPATIGLGYRIFAAGAANESHRIDFVFPDATNKAAVDALVINRKFAINVPEGVIVLEPRSYVSSTVVTGGFHRERYSGTITPKFTGFTNTSDGNNDYQTTLYRGVESGSGSGVIADGSITTAKLAPLAVTGPKIADGVVSETKLSAAVVTKLNASGSGGGNEIVDGLINDRLFDMQWDVEVQTYDDASVPASPATIGIAMSYAEFGSFKFGTFDFIVPTATTKADLDDLVLGKQVVFELPEGVLRFRIDRNTNNTAVITGGYHRERYQASPAIDVPDGFTNTDSNNDYQTTLYRVIDNSYLSLTDTPVSFTGQAGKFVRVNSLERGLEYASFRKLTSLWTGAELLANGTNTTISLTLPSGKNIRDFDEVIFKMTGITRRSSSISIKAEYTARGIEIDTTNSGSRILLGGVSGFQAVECWKNSTGSAIIMSLDNANTRPNTMIEVVGVEYT